MSRWLGLSLAVYAPHLLEEALMGMHDDPLIAAAFTPLQALSPRHATYLVFQAMILLALAALFLFSLGGKAQRAVMFVLALALLAESHHLLRALWTRHYNPGLATALPMPILGALMLRKV